MNMRRSVATVAPWLLLITLILPACAGRSVMLYSPCIKRIIAFPLNQPVSASDVLDGFGVPTFIRQELDGSQRWGYLWKFATPGGDEYLEVVFDARGQFVGYSRDRFPHPHHYRGAL